MAFARLRVKYTHGVVRWLLGPHNTLPCVLIYFKKFINPSKCERTKILMHCNALNLLPGPYITHYY